jgi:hypothetical protein
MVKLRVNDQGGVGGRSPQRQVRHLLPIGDRFALREKRGGFPRPASRAR